MIGKFHQLFQANNVLGIKYTMKHTEILARPCFYDKHTSITARSPDNFGSVLPNVRAQDPPVMMLPPTAASSRVEHCVATLLEDANRATFWREAGATMKRLLDSGHRPPHKVTASYII